MNIVGDCMNLNHVSYEEIVEKMKAQRKRGNIFFIIFTVCMLLILGLTFSNKENFLMAIIIGAFYVVNVIATIYRNAVFNNKLGDLEQK